MNLKRLKEVMTSRMILKMLEGILCSSRVETYTVALSTESGSSIERKISWRNCLISNPGISGIIKKMSIRKGIKLRTVIKVSAAASFMISSSIIFL
jgi:hypothetical protein